MFGFFKMLFHDLGSEKVKYETDANGFKRSINSEDLYLTWRRDSYVGRTPEMEAVRKGERT